MQTPEQIKERRHRYYLRKSAEIKLKAKHYHQRKKYDPKYVENRKQWQKRNQEKERIRKRTWRAANIEKARASVQEHYKRNPEKKEEHREYTKKWSIKRAKERYATEPAFRMEHLLRSRFRLLIKRSKGTKSASAMKLIGCTRADFLVHIERQFKLGMTWANHGYGPGKWNLDHIRPCASFDLAKPEDQACCFHFSNFQPLWHEENKEKADRYFPILCEASA